MQKKYNNYGVPILVKKKTDFGCEICLFPGAADRGRTDTVSLPLDFESSASANSTTAANHITFSVYHIYFKKSSIF